MKTVDEFLASHSEQYVLSLTNKFLIRESKADHLASLYNYDYINRTFVRQSLFLFFRSHSETQKNRI